MSRQLALPLAVRSYFTAAGFVRGPANEAAWHWLEHPSRWPALRLAVHGPQGVGKTHLLHAFAERQGGVLIPGEAVRYLVDLPLNGAIAVDDADAAPEPTALLHLLNAAGEARVPVLLAGRTAPAQWNTPLPDLASRLRATTAVPIGQPDDEMLADMLARRLAERQVRVDPAVQTYLLARLPRHGAALREAAWRLDRASLAEGKRAGRALAAQLLVDMGAENEGPPPDVMQHGSHGAPALL